VRKAVNLERVNGKTPRERLYAVMVECRNTGTAFSVRAVAKSCLPAISLDTARTYFTSLEKAGLLIRCGYCSDVVQQYQLAEHAPGTAPRVRRDGTLVEQGRGNAAMWGTLRRLFTGESCTVAELVAHASTADYPIAYRSAQDYLNNLIRAGYVDRSNGKYWLIPGKDTGPLPPMVQRSTAIYDPNLGAVVWQSEVTDGA